MKQDGLHDNASNLYSGSVPSSNIGQDINYPNWGIFVVFSQSLGKCQDSTLNQVMTKSFHILSHSFFTVIQ
jgi:hypothetical protein